MLDVPAGPETSDADGTAGGDVAELVCVGTACDHLGRPRRCAWHLVLHRHRKGDWIHLYRVLPDHGSRVPVLLDRVLAGDARAVLRHHAGRRAGYITRHVDDLDAEEAR